MGGIENGQATVSSVLFVVLLALLSDNGVRSFAVFEEFVVYGLSQLLPQERKTGGEGDVGRANCFRTRLKRKGLRFTR